MPDNIVIQTNPKVITVTQQSNNIVVSAPGPQGPTGQMIIANIPTVSPIINTGSSIAFDQVAQYITLDTRYAKITGSVQYSASSGSALYSTNAGSATYATNSGSSLYSNLSASTSQTNFATLFIAGSAVATQSYVNNASVLFAVLSSSAQYASSAGYATNSGSSDYATNSSSATYAASASFATNSGSSLFATNATNSSSANFATSAGNSNTTSQTDFNPLTISGSAVATQDYVNSQDFQKSTGSVAFATNSGSSSYATNSGNSLTTSQTSFNNINITASTQSTNTVNGALVVAGGIGTGDSVNIGGNLNVTGNIFMSGSAFTVGASNLEVIDSIILLSASNYYSDLLDIGFYGAYGSTGHDSASNHYHTGLVRDHLDDKWKLFSSGSETSPNTIDFNTATYDTLKLGTIEVSSSAQVDNLNAQYLAGIGSASYARLNQAQTFIGTQTFNNFIQAYGNQLQSGKMTLGQNTFDNNNMLTVTSNASTNVGISVKSSASQTADNFQVLDSSSNLRFRILSSGRTVIQSSNITNPQLLIQNISTNQSGDFIQFQNLSASILAGVTASGQIYTGSNTPLYISSIPAQLSVRSAASTATTILAQSASGQTTNIYEALNQDGTSVFRVRAGGNLGLGSLITGVGFGLNMNLMGAGTIGMVTRGYTGQTADLQQFQDNNANILAGVTASGQFYTGLTSPIVSGSSAQLSVQTSGSTTPGIIVRMSASQTSTAYPLEIEDSLGTTKSYLSTSGGGHFTAQLSATSALTAGTSNYLTAALSVIPLNDSVNGAVIKGFSASQTADLQQWQKSDSTVLSRVTSIGSVIAPYLVAGPSGIASTRLYVNPSAAEVGAVIRGSASQTANIQEWQDSNGSALLRINSRGFISGLGSYGFLTGQSQFDPNGNLTVNFFTALQGTVLRSSASTSIPVTVRGSASQTANLQEWQSSDTTIMARVTNIGEIVTSTTVYANGVQNNNSYWSFNNNGVGQIAARNATNIPLTLKGSASQTANLQEWQDSAGAVVAGINNVGGYFNTNRLAIGFSSVQLGAKAIIGVSSSTDIGLIVRGTASQTEDLQEWQNSSGSALAGVNASGQLYTGSAGPVTNLAGTTQSQLSAVSSASNIIPLIVRRPATGTANTFEIQQSAGTPYVWVDQNMVLNSIAAFNARPATIDATPINSYPTTINHRADLFRVADSTNATTRAAFNAAGQIYTGSAQPILTTVSTISSISASSLTASVTTTTASHNLSVGQIVYITGASPNEYNGNFAVNAIISSSAYLISKSSAFATSSAVTPGTVSLPAQISVVTASANTPGILVKYSASQTAFPFAIYDSVNSVKFYVNQFGNAIANSGIQVTGNIGSFPVAGAMVVNPANATSKGIVFKANASATANMLEVMDSSNNILYGVNPIGQIFSGSAGPLTNISGSAAQLSVVTSGSTTPGIIVRAASSQVEDYQQWQDSTGTIKARVSSNGEVFGTGVRTLNTSCRLLEESAGGNLQLKKSTSAVALPGTVDFAKLYLRDGTVPGTLKLVVRAGTAGAETPILDNIDQTNGILSGTIDGGSA
jgi:hypothetical protein